MERKKERIKEEDKRQVTRKEIWETLYFRTQRSMWF